MRYEWAPDSRAKPHLFRYTPMWWACSSDQRDVHVRSLYLGKTPRDAYDLWALTHLLPSVPA